MWHVRCQTRGIWSAARLAGAVRLFLAVGCGLLFVPPANARPDLTVLTRENNETIAEGLVVVRLEGIIAPPMAHQLDAIWARLGPTHRRLLIDLDSPGGELHEAETLIKVIAAIRTAAEVDTLVRHDATCASACVAIFLQGTKRHAGGSSTWLFHGACHERTNVPNLGQTDRFLAILRAAGVTTEFLCLLVEEGYVTTPGKLWVSGYELVHVYHANIITDLMEPWRPEPPRAPPFSHMIGPH